MITRNNHLHNHLTPLLLNLAFGNLCITVLHYYLCNKNKSVGKTEKVSVFCCFDFSGYFKWTWTELRTRDGSGIELDNKQSLKFHLFGDDGSEKVQCVCSRQHGLLHTRVSHRSSQRPHLCLLPLPAPSVHRLQDRAPLFLWQLALWVEVKIIFFF